MGKEGKLAPPIFAGVCVSPFKAVESELMAQYFKLKKIEARAKLHHHPVDTTPEVP
jgi:hypothetical protein